MVNLDAVAGGVPEPGKTWIPATDQGKPKLPMSPSDANVLKFPLPRSISRQPNDEQSTATIPLKTSQIRAIRTMASGSQP